MNREMNREKVTSTFAKLILVAISMSSMLALGTQTASAQAIIVTTPFAFSAGSQSYPAGTYQFTLLSEWSLSIRNVNGGGERFFKVIPEENGTSGSQGSLTFRDSEGHSSLQAVYVPGADRAAEVAQHDTRSNRAKSDMTLGSAVSSEKITVEKHNATGRRDGRICKRRGATSVACLVQPQNFSSNSAQISHVKPLDNLSR